MGAVAGAGALRRSNVRRILITGMTNQARAVCLIAIGRTSAAAQKRP
jgi:hypothetical protein